MRRRGPHDGVVGTIRRFDFPDPNPRRLVTLGTQIGQTLFEPPDVEGWPGQTAWIDTNRPRICPAETDVRVELIAVILDPRHHLN